MREAKKKGYARNVCAFANSDTLTCLTRVLTFSRDSQNALQKILRQEEALKIRDCEAHEIPL